MKRDCPTLQEMLALDAVARYESLTMAAHVLCVSVSAVSKQVAGLEVFLGRKLLTKYGRGVQLTPQGRIYWQKIAPALRTIETATFEARSGDAGAGVLTLASAPTFLTKWLIPRLPGFSQHNRHVTLSFSRHLESTDGLPASVDAAIRYGEDIWPGTVSDYIAGSEFVLVASPGLLAQCALQPFTPADVVAQTLLHHEGTPQAWRHWAERHAINPMRTVAGPRFAQYSALIQATLNGLGVGLVPQALIEAELADGSLCIPCGDSVELPQGHYLCYQPERLEQPAFAAFRQWVLQQGALSAREAQGQRALSGLD
jgi:LysR family glycine cleavage system transcriptional activator